MVGDSFANHCHLVGSTHILFRKRGAEEDGPSSDFKVGRGFAQNAREPILVAGCNLAAALNFRADSGDPGNLAFNRFSVLSGQCTCAAPTRMNPAAGHAAGKDQDHVLSHAGYLGLDLRLGSVANSNHGDNSADPDNHAQHGEQCAKQIAPQGPHGNLDRGDNPVHVLN